MKKLLFILFTFPFTGSVAQERDSLTFELFKEKIIPFTWHFSQTDDQHTYNVDLFIDEKHFSSISNYGSQMILECPYDLIVQNNTFRMKYSELLNEKRIMYLYGFIKEGKLYIHLAIEELELKNDLFPAHYWTVFGGSSRNNDNALKQIENDPAVKK